MYHLEGAVAQISAGGAFMPAAGAGGAGGAAVALAVHLVRLVLRWCCVGAALVLRWCCVGAALVLHTSHRSMPDALQGEGNAGGGLCSWCVHGAHMALLGWCFGAFGAAIGAGGAFGAAAGVLGATICCCGSCGCSCCS